MIESNEFNSVDEAFFEFGIEQSEFSDSVLVETVASWFDDVHSSADKTQFYYWVDPPFVFVECSTDEEYILHTPSLSESEEDILYHSSVKEKLSTLPEFKSNYELADAVEYFMGEQKFELKFLPYLRMVMSPYGELYPLLSDAKVSDIICMQDEAVLVKSKFYQQHPVTANISTSRSDLDKMLDELDVNTDDSVLSRTYDDGRIVRCFDGDKLLVRIETEYTGDTLPRFIQHNTLDLQAAALLWLAVDQKKNILIAGDVPSETTNFLTSLLDVLPQQANVISVSDGQKLQRDTPFSRHFSREEFTSADQELSFISEMLPTYTVIQDVYDATEWEALVSIMKSNKSVIASVPGGSSLQSLIYKTTSAPRNGEKQDIALFDLLISFATLKLYSKDAGSVVNVNRVDKIAEVEWRNEKFCVSDLYYREYQRDEFIDDTENSQFLEEIQAENGWSEDRLHQEVESREHILDILCQDTTASQSDIQSVFKTISTRPITEINTNVETVEELQTVLEQ